MYNTKGQKEKERPGPGVEHGLHRQHSKTARALPTCTNPADSEYYFPELNHHRSYAISFYYDKSALSISMTRSQGLESWEPA